MTSVQKTFMTLNSHQKPIAGDTKISIIRLDHLGWLLCDGRLLSISEYTFLFNVIGYSFGGSGGQFNLPNPAGRVPGITGSGAGLTTRTMGQSVGAETHTLTVAEMPTHTHGVFDPGHAHSYVNQPNATSVQVPISGTDVADNVNVSQNTGSNTTGITLSNAGLSNAHNNMQPTLFLGNFFIYSGRPNVGNFPFTAGFYVGGTNMLSNVI